MDTVAFRIRAAASEVSGAFEQSRTATGLHAAGVAALLESVPTSAVEKLRLATLLRSDDMPLWNDLGAALYERARREDNIDDLAEALGASDRALELVPNAPEALFNRALILESLWLRPSAIAAWQVYQRVDPTTQWAGEAKWHVEQLQRASRPTSWPQESAVFLSEVPDEDAIRRVTFRYPEETRRFAEASLLADWASSVLSGNRAAATLRLARLQTTAEALAERNGEPMLADAVAAILHCHSPICTEELARAHVVYDEARRLYGSHHVEVALALFRKASILFRARGSPMALASDYYAASCSEDRSDPAALTEIDRLLSRSPGRYVALRAQLLWERGTAQERVGKVVEALDPYTSALAIFERLGETNNAARMRNAVAAVEDSLGRPVEAWRFRTSAFRSFSDAGDMAALQTGIELAARMEAVRGRWSEALALFDVVVERPYRVNPRLHVNALLWRALAAHRLGRSAWALQQLRVARQLAVTISDRALRETAIDDLTFAEASVLRSSDAAAAARLLDSYIQRSRARQRTTVLAEACLERARAARSLRETAVAIRFFQEALTEVGHRQRESSIRGIVDVYFATGAAAATELVDLLESQGREQEAFSALERARGRTLLDRVGAAAQAGSEPLDSEQIRRRLPESTLLFSYAAFDDRIVAFTVSRRRGLVVTRMKCTRPMVEGEISRFRRAIARDDVLDSGRGSEELERLLIVPLRQQLDGMATVVITADSLTERIPFAALREKGGPYLVERVAIVRAPSASIFIRSLQQSGAARFSKALIVGNPSFDRVHFEALQALPAAEREARSIARNYRQTVVLTRNDATASRVTNELASSGIVDIAAHAIANRHDPMRSMLLLAPNAARSGILYAGEVASMHLSASVVVLAGCRTAETADTNSDVSSFALAFLAAGAESVVGTLWDVDDNAAADFSSHFHPLIAAGVAPEEAIRRTQCDLLKRLPLRSWSAFSTIR